MKKLRKKCWVIIILLIVNLSLATENEKQKRQIFREQVLPALGGKIPEEAFRSDRLVLNRLNKEGITVPDGVVLDARRVVKYSDAVMANPDLIKVYLTPDGRYVPPEGRFHYNGPKTVDTTYVIRMPVDYYKDPHANLPNAYKAQGYANYHQFNPEVPFYNYKPIVTPLIFPTKEDGPIGSLGSYYRPHVWHVGSDWDVIYSPYNSFFIDKEATLYNSNPVIPDYQGVLHDFHDRSLRHIDREKNANALLNKPNPDRKETSATSGYTKLTSVPKTGFSCTGRTGTFADVETKCQVFHECTAWSKTSSLCPQGTAYSEDKKRCEWWHEVTCH